MRCNKVVYHVPGNKFISAYCCLEEGHEERDGTSCRYIPEESLVQLCKQILLDRGEVVIPLRPRSRM